MTRRLTRLGLVALLLWGCDETRVRTGASELTTLENDAVRVLVSSSGIGRLVEVANPEGFPLRAESRLVEGVQGIEASLGPLEQILAVSSRSSTPGSASVSLTTRLNGSTVFVPIRVRQQGETRICRWRIDASRIETTASLVLVDGEDGKEFGVEDTPSVTIDGLVPSPVDDCSDLAALMPADLDAQLAAYVSAAVAGSASASLPSSPLDVLGLLRGNVRLTRTSPFANRSGTLIVEAEISPRADALAISPDGLSVAIDATAEADRARCAPPASIDVPTGNGAAALDPTVVRRFGADFAIAVSTTWLSRVAQGTTLAGYACRGLEDARRPEVNAEVIPTSDVLLEEINLAHVPIGPFTTLTLAPGTLPVLELRPDSGTIGVVWNDIQVEVYGEVFGARTRLARVVADARLGLRPTAQVVGVAKFELASIEVTTDRIDSEFFAVPPATEDVDRWMRRTLLSLLEERFEFPIPLAPASPVRVVSVQVRPSDVVMFLRFD